MVLRTICKVWFSIVLVCALVLGTGCQTRRSASIHLVFERDLSKSIEPSARRSSIEKIRLASCALARGDSFTVIPITEDASDRASDQVIRVRFGEERTAFDDDLMQLLASEQKGLERMEAGNPPLRTDLFGSLALAEEDCATVQAGDVKAIAILSDFIEDDGRYNFLRAKALRNPEAATKFADQLAPSPTLQGVHVYLGLLPSVSYRSVSATRRKAIKAFWIRSFERRGAEAEWATDGLGSLETFVDRLAGGRPDRTPVGTIFGGSDMRNAGAN